VKVSYKKNKPCARDLETDDDFPRAEVDGLEVPDVTDFAWLRRGQSNVVLGDHRAASVLPVVDGITS